MKKQIQAFAIPMLILMVVVLTSCGPIQRTSYPGELENTVLEFTLELDQPAYSRSDQIIATFSLRNIGNEDLVVNARMAPNSASSPEPFRDITLLLTSLSGNEVPFSARVDTSFPRADNFVTLSPGEKFDKSINLALLFNFPQEVGFFTVRAIYSNSYDPSSLVDAWKGSIESDTISFQIGP